MADFSRQQLDRRPTRRHPAPRSGVATTLAHIRLPACVGRGVRADVGPVDTGHTAAAAIELSYGQARAAISRARKAPPPGLAVASTERESPALGRDGLARTVTKLRGVAAHVVAPEAGGRARICPSGRPIWPRCR